MSELRRNRGRHQDVSTAFCPTLPCVAIPSANAMSSWNSPSPMGRSGGLLNLPAPILWGPLIPRPGRIRIWAPGHQIRHEELDGMAVDGCQAHRRLRRFFNRS